MNCFNFIVTRSECAGLSNRSQWPSFAPINPLIRPSLCGGGCDENAIKINGAGYFADLSCG